MKLPIIDTLKWVHRTKLPDLEALCRIVFFRIRRYNSM